MDSEIFWGQFLDEFPFNATFSVIRPSILPFLGRVIEPLLYSKHRIFLNISKPRPDRNFWVEKEGMPGE